MWRVAAVIVLAAGVAFATSYAPPTKHDVRSANGQFVLHVDPDTKRHAVSAGWSFERPIQFESFCVADDGKSVAVVAWHFVQVDNLGEPAVELWNASGRFATIAIRDLIPSPSRVRGVGPIGGFWREWLDEVRCTGTHAVIATTGLYEYAVDLATGAHTRSWSLPGIGRYATGVLALLGAIALVVWASRRREPRVWVASISPLTALTWLWLELAGVPYVPADATALLQMTLIAIAVLALVPSVLAARKVQRGGPLLAAIAALLGLAVVVVRFLW